MASGGRSMIPASTSELKQRPTTAPALATAWASTDRCDKRASTASSIVSGNRRLPNCQAVRASLRTERPEQLLDVEREAIRPLVDGGRDLAWGGEPGIEEECRDQRRVAR